MPLSLRVDSLVVDVTIQPRVRGLDAAHVTEMADWLKANPKDDLPPIRVYRVDGDHLVSRGFHRHAAYSQAGRAYIPAEQFEGTRDDAALDAAASNTDHGLKRTNDDKRRAVVMTLGLRPEWPNTKIAEWCAVAHDTVNRIRAELAACSAASTPDKTAETDDSSVSGSAGGGKERRGTRGPTSKNEDHSAAAAKLLVADPTVTDEGIAFILNCKAAVVTRARKALLREGLIPDPTAETPAAKGGPSAPADEEPEADGPTVIMPTAEPEADQDKPAGKPKPPPAVDAWGITIQPHAVQAFEAVPKFNELLALLRRVRGELTELVESPGGRHLLRRCQFHRSNNKHGGRWVLAELDNAIGIIEDATPRHTDCPYHFNTFLPHGDDENGRPCPLCDNKRFTGDLRKRQVPPDLLTAMRAYYGVTEGAD